MCYMYTKENVYLMSLKGSNGVKALSLHATDPDFIATTLVSPHKNYQIWSLNTDIGTNTEHIRYNFNTLP